MKEQARNPENWKELEGLEHIPEIRKRLEEEVDNPELWRKIKEQSLDPAYWREVEEQIQNPDIWKKMEFSAKDPKAWEFLEEQKEARPFDLLPLPPSDVTKPPSPPEPTPSPSPTPTPTPTPPPPPPEPKCLQWRDTLLGKHTLEKVKPGGEPSPHLDCLEDVMHVALRRARHKHTEEASDLQTENITRVLAKFASESKYLNENRHMTDKFGPRWSTAFKKMDGWQQLRFLNWQGVFKANEFLEDDEWMKGHLRPDGHEGAETMDLYYQREFGKYQIAVLEWRFLDGPKPDIEGW
ncbi:hypothetical protein Daus18300_010491 [Diaporthe australafricana]|uniref:Uncharacterized protein n=1 Tax=Diaporthe australafricana TaxID=127596 RepID=A0ABR3WA48_9PEZI